jgi:hypothetical protein
LGFLGEHEPHLAGAEVSWLEKAASSSGGDANLRDEKFFREGSVMLFSRACLKQFPLISPLAATEAEPLCLQNISG